jgi:DNA-binding beta-propeller fold protein YncE
MVGKEQAMSTRFARTTRAFRIAAAAAVLVSVFAVPAPAATPSFLYSLSDFAGTVPGNWVKLASDRERSEIYMLDTSSQTLRVFNDSGMEIYRFPESAAIVSASGVAVAEDGRIFLLCAAGAKWKVVATDYRGEAVSDVLLPAASLPEDFTPDAIAVRSGSLYLADREHMKIAVVPPAGDPRVIDVAPLAGFTEEKRRDANIVGFSVDARGNILVTIPVIFQAYVVSPDGKASSFGSRGSTPGKFNIAGGIAADDEGNIYVTDTLRCVVMAFDRDFRFVSEFGYRGSDPGNLISPMDLAVVNGKLYVTQSRNRGVAVFRVTG